MSMPLTPAPRLSEAATPIVLPPPPPDMDLAFRQFSNGASGQRDLVERELLGHAMGSPAGLAALRQLQPREFSIPINQTIAKTIVELADAGLPHDAAAVTATLRERPLADIAPPAVTTRRLQEKFVLAAMDGQDELGTLLRMDLGRFDPDLRLVAEVIVDLEAVGSPTDRLTIQRQLESQDIDSLVPKHSPAPVANSQLPSHLDPRLIKGGRADPDSVGLGAWQSTRLLSEGRAPMCAIEIRSEYRRDLGIAAARQAWHQYGGALESDQMGRIVSDNVGDVTKDLADHLVSIPRALVAPQLPAAPSADLRLPKAPALSAAGRAALR